MKGVSNSKLFPITSLLGIHVCDETVQLLTYDGINSVYTYADIKGVSEEHYVVIDATSFNNLISKITAEEIKLVFSDDDMTFGVKTPSGSYTFDVAFEEGIGAVQFPDNMSNVMDNQISDYEINLKNLLLAVDINQPAAAKTSEVISLTGAYFGDKLITSDSYVACITHKKVFKEELLLNYSTLSLLSIFGDAEKVHYVISNDKICFYDNDSVVVGNLMPQVKDFPGKEIAMFLEFQFEGNCKISKSELLGALDRLSIFITPFDKNIIELHFTKDNKLVLKSLNGGAIEVISIKSNIESICKTAFDSLKNQVSTTQEETITIKFGNEKAIAIEDSQATHIISLAEVS